MEETRDMQSRELIIKYLAGESTEDERLAVDRWVGEKAENKRYFDEIAFLWKVSGISREVGETEKRSDWDKLMERIGKKTDSDFIMQESMREESRRISSTGSRAFLNRFLKIAAIFIVGFSFSWAAFSFLDRRPQSDSLSCTQFITAKGQKSQIILCDGTRVWLNAETVLRYPAAFNEDQREVYLEGEAYFEVQKKENKVPFIVKTSDIDIEVVGTRFNVMAYSDEETVETTVVEGSIYVVRKGKESLREQNVLLKTNQKATIIKKGSHIILSEVDLEKPTPVKSDPNDRSESPIEQEQIVVSRSVDVELHTAWKDDLLVFQSETLENLTYKLERWYDVNIHIEDEELKSYRYTGKFVHKETLNQVLEILSLTTPIHYTFEQNDLYIEKATK
jgi:transmembrane sensor